jgi:hypothetical protein
MNPLLRVFTLESLVATDKIVVTTNSNEMLKILDQQEEIRAILAFM